MQLSAKLRTGPNGSHLHYCPACEMAHQLPSSWTFDDNVDSPTYTPSFKHHYGIEKVCHYTLTDGVLNFHEDCTHGSAGQAVALPDLPEYMQDPNYPE